MIITNAASENHAAQMKKIGDFCDADEVIYRDLGNGEDYLVLKGDQSLALRIRVNGIDGGYLTVETANLL